MHHSVYGLNYAENVSGESDFNFLYESPLLGEIESRFQDGVDGNRRSFSTRLLHHLTDKPRREFWFGFHLFDLVGIGGDDGINRLLDR